MKRVLVGVAVLLSTTSLLAQGIITFSNPNPIYGPEPGNPTESKSGNSPPQTYTGGKLAGPNYWAQLYGAPVGMPESSLVGFLPTTTFRTGAGAGYVAPVNITLDGMPPGFTVVLEMRVWDNSSGLYPTWAAAQPAWLSGAIPAAKSDLLDVMLGSGVTPPPQPADGWQSFNIYYIPEPATAALLALGGAGFWAAHRGRRKGHEQRSGPDPVKGRGRFDRSGRSTRLHRSVAARD